MDPSQKTKLKVGKTKPKAANFTDTSFKAKSIVLSKQSLSVEAPSIDAQFSHHVSLLRSKSDTQRRDSLAHLTTVLTTSPSAPLPEPVTVLVPKLQPLILDSSPAIRQQLLKLLRCLPAKAIERQAEQMLLYQRAAMTHLSADIRTYSLDVLDWLLESAGEEIVSCAGGWYKTLRCFLGLLGWANTSSGSSWTTSSVRAAAKPGAETKALIKQVTSLTNLVRAGVAAPQSDDLHVVSGSGFPYTSMQQHTIPARTSAYAHLNLFGLEREEDNQMLQDREDRQRVFAACFHDKIQKGIEQLKKEAGESGRVAAQLQKAISEGMTDYIDGLE